MFSRIMRHPADLMQKALRKTFGRRDGSNVEEIAARAWHMRISNPRWSLEAPEAQMPRPSVDADSAPGWTGPAFARHLLVRHYGRAASFLVPRPAKAASPKP